MSIFDAYQKQLLSEYENGMCEALGSKAIGENMFNLNVSIIAKHFCIAALWADCPEGTNPRITKEALTNAENYAKEFIAKLAPEDYKALEIAQSNGYGSHPDCMGHIEAAIGHDLYLTIARHGVGFWSRDEFEDGAGDKLSAYCRSVHCEPQFYRGWMYL